MMTRAEGLEASELTTREVRGASRRERGQEEGLIGRGARTGGAPDWPGARGTLGLNRQRKCVLLHCRIMLLICCYLFTIPFDGLKMHFITQAYVFWFY